MKFNGKSFKSVSEETIVFPRLEGNVVFKARAVLDYSAFETVCPAPKPVEVIGKGGVRFLSTETKEYKEKESQYSRRRLAWTIIESLKATPGLEWETVDPNNPETWENYRTELAQAGFTIYEIGRLDNIAIEVCGLSQNKIDEALKSFLAGQAVTVNLESSPNTEQNFTQSGGAVNDGE